MMSIVLPSQDRAMNYNPQLLRSSTQQVVGKSRIELVRLCGADTLQVLQRARVQRTAPGLPEREVNAPVCCALPFGGEGAQFCPACVAWHPGYWWTDGSCWSPRF